jgi:hypothetical protein
MKYRCLHLVFAALISTIAGYGCTIYQKPRPIFAIPFQERSQSKIDGEVRVTVAILSAEESRQLFGVNLASHGIQPYGFEFRMKIQSAIGSCPPALIQIISQHWKSPMPSMAQL